MSFKVFDQTIAFPPAGLDAFNRLRVSGAYTQLESMHLYGGADTEHYYRTEVDGGTITYLTNEAAYNLGVTTSATSLARMRTKEYFTYHPGKSQLMLMTFVLGDSQANTVKRVGYFDDDDGIFLIQDGANGLGVGIRSSTSGSNVETIIYQSDWNVDKLDGTGKSGITLDVANTQIFVADFQWLGVGTVRFGFEIDGLLYLTHKQDHSNKTKKVYMKSGTLPVTYEICNVSEAPAATNLTQICATVISEGGEQPYGEMYATPNSLPITVATGVWTPLISVKSNTTFNGFVNRGKFLIQSIEAFVDGQQPMAYAIYEDANVSATVWESIDANSAIEYSVAAATMNIDTGTRRMISFVPQQQRASLEVSPKELLKGVANTTFTLAALGLAGSSTVRAAINLREIL